LQFQWLSGWLLAAVFPVTAKCENILGRTLPRTTSRRPVPIPRSVLRNLIADSGRSGAQPRRCMGMSWAMLAEIANSTALCDGHHIGRADLRLWSPHRSRRYRRPSLGAGSCQTPLARSPQ
jgi:hypothetical protein